MSPTAHEVRNLLLSQAGFLRADGTRRRGLIDRANARTDADTYLRYDRLFEEMDADSSSDDLIYESPGVDRTSNRPCGYFKVMTDPTPQAIGEFRMKLWNHGRIPTLWVITPQSVRIYNGFARPLEQDMQDPGSHLLAELNLIGDQLINVQQYHRSRFDTGRFWHSGEGRHIDATQRVDQALLRDLRDTETLLRAEGLSPTSAHALLGRTIFVKYLEDRGILQSQHFLAQGNVTRFDQLLEDRNLTGTFFHWLHQTFNGDLFPWDPQEWQAVDPRHLDILSRFLSGHTMKNYPNTQASFWPYSFNIIPIEFISSIYEMLAHAADSTAAEAQSVHYTRIGLVELTLNLTMGDLPHTARILDPACGSGVFLVEAFRRLVWSTSQKLGRQLTRAELHDVLRSQIYGIDIDKDAIYVAAFSLYLALLEMDPDPRPPQALKLPQLVASSHTGEAQNLYIQDFFNLDHEFNHKAPFSNKAFDLIVSNPPWTAWTNETAPVDLGSTSPHVQWGIRYIQSHRIPDAKPDQAFTWRARDFANATTRIAMIIGSRFLRQASPTGKRWRNHFFEANSIESIVDLSDLVNEQLLFGSISSTRLPALLLVFSPRPIDSNAKLQYIAPKLYPGVRNRDEIWITSADLQELPQVLVTEEPFRWNAALRGSPRDLRLLFDLHKLRTLDSILDDIGSRAGLHRGRGIIFGRGAKKEAPSLQGLRFLPGHMPKQRFSLDVNTLPRFSEPFIEKRSTELVLSLPAVVLARSLANNRPSVCLVQPHENDTQLVISQSHYGISFPSNWNWLVYRINAVLNSDFALYWTFMSGTELGVGRRLIETNDWCGIPMPETVLDPNSRAWDDALKEERNLREYPNHGDTDSVLEALNHAVYSVYRLTEQNIVLIKDSVKHTIDPYLTKTRSREVRQPSEEQLRAYAQRVCRQLNTILQHAGQQLSATLCVFSDETTLNACYFALTDLGNPIAPFEIRKGGIDTILNNMSYDLRVALTDNLYIQRDLRVYDPEGFWIFKPSEQRLWTEAAALNDADVVIEEHLEASLL